jgi:hypothetical protein
MRSCYDSLSGTFSHVCGGKPRLGHPAPSYPVFVLLIN